MGQGRGGFGGIGWFDLLARILLAIPFVALVGDYVLSGVLYARSDEDEPPRLSDIVLLGHSLLVLYALGALLAGRRTRLNTAIAISGLARLPATRDPGGRQLVARPRSALDVVTRGQGFLARQSASLTVDEYSVADSLGVGGRALMLTVSAQARTRTMFITDVEQQNAINHCLWQCHYTMQGNTSVAVAFGNAHEAGNPCAIGDTLADRINNEAARRFGATIRPDYVRFYGAVTTSIAKALVDIARDRARDLSRLAVLSNAHEWLTLEPLVIRTPCDDFCADAWREGWLSAARPSEDFFGRLNSTEVERRYLRQLMRLFEQYRVHPRDILPPDELEALRRQAADRWPELFEAPRRRSSAQIEEID